MKRTIFTTERLFSTCTVASRKSMFAYCSFSASVPLLLRRYVHTYLQVALNWCVSKGALPIPGVKNARQAEECAGALGWRLSEGEMMELDRVSAGLPQIPGVDLASV